MARRWNRRQGDPAGDGSLAVACEAFLAGAYVEHVLDRGEAVPVWTWVNLLAHGTEPQLRGAVACRDADPWRAAQRFLAGELLDRAEDRGCPLVELQQTLLVPLELDLAATPAMSRWRPGDLVAAVLGVLPARGARPPR